MRATLRFINSFEAQVASAPDAVAVRLGSQALTYDELNRRSNQLAHYLQKRGVGPETLVGLCVERSLEMIVGLLGILKAGGAYVPLDPQYPSERVALMLKDTGVPILLTRSHLVERLPAGRARVICLDADWDTIARESDENPVINMTPDKLVYIIYTSGSTGRPKGVMVSHRALVNHAQRWDKC